MKNYILMLGVAGVALGSYCACAGNSATMTVTATIAHDVSLTKTGDLDLGTITINPAYEESDTYWSYGYSGIVNYEGAVISASNATLGTFTANISNPSACSNAYESCGGLMVSGNNGETIDNFFGGSDNSNYCQFFIKYSGADNNFKVFPNECGIYDVSKVTTGEHSGTLTISYNPE
ncbi:MAG: hypothetical protein IJ689_01495 [Alphaproteobacteria bacterium]|nr:hypothetical protein [Alphaproteobacteria bacterium]